MSAPQLRSSDRFVVVFVCTGGRYRSRIAAGLTRRSLVERFGSAGAARFEIGVAGTRPASAVADDERLRAELVALDLDPCPAPTAVRLDVGVVDAADLILTAERSHRAAVAQLLPGAREKTYCVRELARLMGIVRCDSLPTDPIDRARAALAVVRDNRGVVPYATQADDDIPDPFGGDAAVYRAATVLIGAAMAEVMGVRPPALAAVRRRVPRLWR